MTDVLFAAFGRYDSGVVGLILWMSVGSICWSPFILVTVVLINRRWNRRTAANPPPDQPV
jgi:hypothetical protein